MPVTYHRDLLQGSDEWLAARCGLVTASEVKLIVTPTLKVADNDKTRTHLWELLSQRITKYVEPSYISDDMLRGQMDEIRARDLYAEKYGQVEECGFITNDRWGFTIGYSPDGLVGDKGLLECKSRRQKFQVQTIVEWFSGQTIPIDYMLQCQTGLLVEERRDWLDLVSYSGGLPMAVMRVWPDEQIHEAIVNAVGEFEARLSIKLNQYREAVEALGFPETERVIEQEMFLS